MNEVFGYAVWFAQICAGLAMLNATIRLFIGPAAQDRILSLDSLYMNGMLMLLLLGIRSRSPAYFDMALLIALFGFVGSVALAKVPAARRGDRTMTAADTTALGDDSRDRSAGARRSGDPRRVAWTAAPARLLLTDARTVDDEHGGCRRDVGRFNARVVCARRAAHPS